jgi:hypothetical protein
MPSAHSTIRVLCLVLVIAVARNASAGSAPTGSYQSGAANVSRPSEQLLISFTVVNIAPAKISNVHVDLRDLRGASAPYGRRSAISLVPGSPTQVARQIHPPNRSFGHGKGRPTENKYFCDTNGKRCEVVYQNLGASNDYPQDRKVSTQNSL